MNKLIRLLYVYNTINQEEGNMYNENPTEQLREIHLKEIIYQKSIYFLIPVNLL